MIIEPISLDLANEIAPRLELRPMSQGSDFGDALVQGIKGINTDLQTAEKSTIALAAGTETSTHDVMIALSQARLELQLVVQVRNRLMSAYQEISRMQV